MRPASPLHVLAGLIGALGAAGYGQVETVQTLAPGVYFHQGNYERGHSNNGWIEFNDFVLVVDANFPAGARIVAPKVKSASSKPIRFVFDTHHHADHAYGNLVWTRLGATIIASTGVLEEMKARETGYFGDKPGNWERVAETRPDVAELRLEPPALLFSTELFFEDKTRRVELRWLGVAHTKGDGFVWLPKERILFTGDVCVNGPYNFVGASNITEWIRTLTAAQQLGAEKICPGHGPVGGPELLIDQQRYLMELQRRTRALADKHGSLPSIPAVLPLLAAELKEIPGIARYVPDPALLQQQAAKVLSELAEEDPPR